MVSFIKLRKIRMVNSGIWYRAIVDSWSVRVGRSNSTDWRGSPLRASKWMRTGHRYYSLSRTRYVRPFISFRAGNGSLLNPDQFMLGWRFCRLGETLFRVNKKMLFTHNTCVWTRTHAVKLNHSTYWNTLTPLKQTVGLELV